MSNLIIGDFHFNAEFAISDDEQKSGLMFRKPTVLIFPYKKAEVRSFWMKNVEYSLDILFCNNNKIISIAYGQPLSERTIISQYPSDLVIEVPSCNKKFVIGDNVKIKYDLITVAKVFEKTLR